MKTTLLRAGIAAAALLSLPFAAQAADLPRPYTKAPDFVAPVYASWSGFYAGINGGYGFGDSSWTNPAVNPQPKGVLAGQRSERLRVQPLHLGEREVRLGRAGMGNNGLQVGGKRVPRL